ncbi:MAG: hypothetical protein PVG64_01715 [Syntrophobacterales bacterium]|jgi:hypothetical protein
MAIVKQKIYMAVSLLLLWLVVANATCDTSHTSLRQEDLVNSYQLARFHLEECEDMGVARLEPDMLYETVRLSDDIEEMIARGSWSQADKALVQMEQNVALMLERLKEWDPDQDGLSNYAELMLYGTSWSDSDSDGDGYFDGSEVLLYETDPLDHCGVPQNVPVEAPVQRRCQALEKLK